VKQAGFGKTCPTMTANVIARNEPQGERRGNLNVETIMKVEIASLRSQ